MKTMFGKRYQNCVKKNSKMNLQENIRRILMEDNNELTNTQKNIISLIEKNGLMFVIKFVGDYDTIKKLLKSINFLTRELMVDFILEVINEYGSMGVNEIGIDPIIYRHDEIHNELHQIEYFSSRRVIVNVYGGPNGDTDEGEYSVSWDSLKTNDLYEIFDGFMGWYEYERNL